MFQRNTQLLNNQAAQIFLEVYLLLVEGPLVYLTYIGIILLVGILCSIIANKLGITNVLFLIVAGLILGHVPFRGEALIFFPDLFVTSIAILALVMIVFDSSSRFKLKEVRAYSLPALNLSIVFLIVNLVLLSLLSFFFFPEISIFWYALVFAAIMSGTDPAVVLLMFKNKKNKILEILEIESIVNTPLTVLIPFIILDIQRSFGEEFIVSQFVSQIGPFLQQIVSGVGAGIIVGIIVFKFMRKEYSETLSPIALITAALFAYILAENLKGNGVLAVTVMGIFFGNLYVKEKEHLSEFSSMFANSLEVFVFVLVGLIISIPFSLSFFVKSLILFGLSMVLRYFAVSFSFRNRQFTFKQKLFMSLNMQKGLSIAVVVLALSTLGIPALKPVLDLSLLFMIYSIVIAVIIGKFASYFLAFEKNTKGRRS